MQKIILASASPRRTELLKQIGIEFTIIPANVNEEINTELTPEEVVVELAWKKASSVARTVETGLVIGADTLVVRDEVLGKPKDEKDAFEMLKLLSGGWHEVLTGISVIDPASGKEIKGYEKTRVKMRELTNDMIMSYIRTGEPMDKAGAYGIQGMGAVLVERLEGCYFNVMGLPLVKLAKILEEFGVKVL